MQIHRACALKLASMPACAKGVSAPSWTELATDAERLAGTQVAVSGRLFLAHGIFSSGVSCQPGVCCNGLRHKVVIEGAPNDLALESFVCEGDDSRLCCNVFASGQSVVVNGRLTRATVAGPPAGWQISNGSLCVVH
jgi:hypothetical protein